MQVPQPQKQPKSLAKKSIIFDTHTYYFEGKKNAIVLPVRPAPTGNPATDQANAKGFLSAIKSIALDLEKSNRNQIIIIHANDQWWQFGSNSLLFYQYHLQKAFELTLITPRRDRDFCKVRYPNNPGCAIIKNISLFTANLTSKAKAKIILDTPEIIIFKLRHTYSPADVNSFYNIRATKEAHFNSLTVPKIVHPGTHRATIHLTKLIIDKSSGVDPFRRHCYCAYGIQLITWISINFASMANGRVNSIHYYTESIKKLHALSDWLVLVKGVDLFPIDVCTRIAEDIDDLRSRMEVDLSELKAAQHG